MYRGGEENLRQGVPDGERRSPPGACAPSGSEVEQNPPLRPHSFDEASSGLAEKLAYTIYEVAEATSVPLKTVRRDARDGLLVSVHFNSKVEVYLLEDIRDWLWRRRSIPASTETRENLKKKRTRRTARRAALPPETEESQRRRAKYDELKRRLERD